MFNKGRKFAAQNGYAMLGTIAFIGVAATAVVVTSLSATAVRNEQGRKTSSSLALAKQALIAYAASSNSRPGSLPCPDLDNDGQSDPVTGACTSLIGRLPWQTLGLPDLRDAGGERLWYALSQQFNDAGNVINSNTAGELNVTGTIAVDRAAAIVFAPGAPINGQLRDQERSYSVSQYIEEQTGTTPPSFATSDAGGTYNDHLKALSAVDIFLVVERRVAKEAQAALKVYSDSFPPLGRLPWYSTDCSLNDVWSCPAVNPLPPRPITAVPWSATAIGYFPTDNSGLNAVLPAWFIPNRWNSIVRYRVDSDYLFGVSTCGKIASSANSVGGNNHASIGSNGGTANMDTKAVLSIASVSSNTNHQTAMLNVAMQ